jgi:hypothetical protein
MDKGFVAYLKQMELGEPVQHENMTIFPLFTAANHSPEYITLAEALERQSLAIAEVSTGGSVPEVKVTSSANLPVLLLEGEELAGAKQNRVLNTSILLRERDDTVIPVSCTEQGRWAYTSQAFVDSGHISPSKLRFAKERAVTQSLKLGLGHRSDQGEVWEEVAEMMSTSDTTSPTGAMRDVYLARQREVEGYLEAFEPQPEQKGLLVLVNGEAVGLDIVSREDAYRRLHPKLVKSYAMDALLERQDGGSKDGEAAGEARRFVEAAARCEEEKFESVGHGWDHRFGAGGVVGSALTYQDKVIHMAFFQMTEGHKRRRAAFRQRRPRRPGLLE